MTPIRLQTTWSGTTWILLLLHMPCCPQLRLLFIRALGRKVSPWVLDFQDMEAKVEQQVIRRNPR